MSLRLYQVDFVLIIWLRYNFATNFWYMFSDFRPVVDTKIKYACNSLSWLL